MALAAWDLRHAECSSNIPARIHRVREIRQAWQRSILQEYWPISIKANFNCKLVMGLSHNSCTCDGFSNKSCAHSKC